VRLEHRDYKVIQDLQVIRERKEILDRRVRLEYKEQQVLKEHKGI
jgi:hypothetical protein